MNGLSLFNLKKNQPETCCICSEDVTNFVWHESGQDHMTCLDCARRWTKENIDNPSCAICKTKIDPKSILNAAEINHSFEAKQLEKNIERIEQIDSDERFARGLEERPALVANDDADLIAAIAASLDPAQRVVPHMGLLPAPVLELRRGEGENDPDLAAGIAASLDPAQDVVQRASLPLEPNLERGEPAQTSTCSMMSSVTAVAAIAAVIIGLM